VARNRKRAKERRARRPTPAPVSRPGVATARAEPEELPSPLEHAAPDAELADAQLAIGRAELDAEPEPLEADDELADEGAGDYGDDSGAAPPGEEPDAGGGEVAPASPPSAVEHRQVPGNRLINFLQGSWRELHRVQWPDRRQVMQATGVVIGFVIVAGVFLGVADAVASKVVNFILK
jgi:preprotein translocase subunit SecE